jgi:hypothetical protein
MSISRIVAVGWPWATALAGGALISAGLGGLLARAEFDIVTAGLQAIGVVIALGLGAATLRRDSHDRRVDRVLALHEGLMTGELWLARRRLIIHFRCLIASPAEGVPVVTRQQLRDDPLISRYSVDGGAPQQDVDLVISLLRAS